jgi:hypothetical protein
MPETMTAFLVTGLAFSSALFFAYPLEEAR